MKVPARQFLAWALVLALAALVSGCTTFHREWQAAAAKPASDSLEGRWEGRWLSAANGHTGSLRCLLTRENDARYHARFHATYRKIFRAGYHVEFTGEMRAGAWQFTGDENLGWFAGGVYQYEGRVTPTNFFSTYRCKYDHGTFELRRPK